MLHQKEESTARSVPDLAVLILVAIGGLYLFNSGSHISVKSPAPEPVKGWDRGAHPLCRDFSGPAIAAKSHNKCVSWRDLDLATRVAIFETRGEGQLGKIAVAHVIKNRWMRNPYGWKSIADVVTAKKQFEPWLKHKTKLMKINPKGTEYRRMRAIIKDALEGGTADPTKGAFYFLNVAVVKKRGMSKEWKKIIKHPACLDIGRHRFCPRV